MAQEYEKKELRQHIFDTPDTYVGGIESISVTQPILSISGNEKQIVHKEIEIIPVSQYF